jgi:ribosomal protein L34E
MTKQKKIHYCAECGEELKGCPCGWSKTSDGKVVHRKCKPNYESKLKNKSQSNKPVCAYCGGEFEGKPYFMAMDGKYVHFKCQKPYELELYKNK